MSTSSLLLAAAATGLNDTTLGDANVVATVGSFLVVAAARDDLHARISITNDQMIDRNYLHFHLQLRRLCNAVYHKQSEYDSDYRSMLLTPLSYSRFRQASPQVLSSLLLHSRSAKTSVALARSTKRLIGGRMLDL